MSHGPRLSQRQVKWSEVDSGRVTELLRLHNPPDLDVTSNYDAVFGEVDELIRDTLAQAKKPSAHSEDKDPHGNRWKHIAEENDPKVI